MLGRKQEIVNDSPINQVCFTSNSTQAARKGVNKGAIGNVWGFWVPSSTPPVVSPACKTSNIDVIKPSKPFNILFGNIRGLFDISNLTKPSILYYLADSKDVFAMCS